MEDSPAHPRPHLLPTGVEEVSQPHDIAVVQLTHNLQLSVLGSKGKAPQTTADSPCLPSLVPLATALLLHSCQHSQAPTPCILAPGPSEAAPNSSPQPIPLTYKLEAYGLSQPTDELFSAHCSKVSNVLLTFENQMSSHIKSVFQLVLNNQMTWPHKAQVTKNEYWPSNSLWSPLLSIASPRGIWAFEP